MSPGLEREVDPGIARGAQAAIWLAQVDDPARVGTRMLQRGGMSLAERAAVIDDHDAIVERRLLGESGADRFIEQHRVLENGQDNRDQRIRTAGGSTRTPALPVVVGSHDVFDLLHGSAPVSRARS